jgi:hypothetical protein
MYRDETDLSLVVGSQDVRNGSVSGRGWPVYPKHITVYVDRTSTGWDAMHNRCSDLDLLPPDVR